MQTFDVNKFDILKFDGILARGLSNGLGKPNGQMCIEAAICNVLNLPHSDDPGCVIPSLRHFKISLNDKQWSSPSARAKGLRDLGLAQLGSLGVVDDIEFSKRIAEKTIKVLIPKLFRSIFTDGACLSAADRCEKEGTAAAAHTAAYAAYADASAASAAAAAAAHTSASAASAAAYAAYAADAAHTSASAASAAAASAYAASAYAAYAYAAYAASNEFLCLSATLAIEVLRELKSPGCALLDKSHEI